MSMFEIGEMVVAVWRAENEPDREAARRYCQMHFGKDWPPGVGELEDRRIYMIRGFDTRDSGNLGIYLHEIINPIGPAGYEWAYSYKAFRKLRKTSIEELRKLVAPVKPRELEPSDPA